MGLQWIRFFPVKLTSGYRNPKERKSQFLHSKRMLLLPFLHFFYGFPLDFLGSKHGPGNLVIPPIEKQPASVRFPMYRRRVAVVFRSTGTGPIWTPREPHVDSHACTVDRRSTPGGRVHCNKLAA
jgi:hypothetical protein